MSLKLEAKRFGSLAAQQHTLHKDLEVIHDRTKMGIDRQFKLDKCVCFINLQALPL